MKSASIKLTIMVAAMIVLSLALVAVFRLVYEPQLALRAMLKDPSPDTAEADRLLIAAGSNRLDLTDTLQLARMLESLGRVDDALSIFSALSVRHPDTPVIKLWYAERLQQYGRWAEAESRYLELLKMVEAENNSVNRPNPHFWRASEQELAIARRYVIIDGDSSTISAADIYRKLAENAMSAALAGDGAARLEWFRKSEGFFVSCIEINPDNHEARGAYANLLLHINQPSESLLNYQMLLEAEPENLGWLISASIAAGADKKFVAGERYIRDALRMENRPEWRLELARFMSWGGKHEAAISELDALIEEYPARADYRRERADFLLNAGLKREYLEDTARLAAANPLDINLRLERVAAMIGTRLYADAIYEASALLAIDPDNYKAALLKAEALLWSGDYRAAQADLMILSHKLPDSRLVRKRMAQALLWNRQFDESVMEFRKLEPGTMDDLEVAQGFAEAVAQKKAPSAEDAAFIMAMRRKIMINPDADWPAPLLAAIGRSLREMGQTEAAVELLETAVFRAAANLKLRLELADLLQAIGRHAEADREYRFITNQKTKDSTP